MQTPEGRLKAKQTIRDRYGVDADGKSLLYQTIGTKGGSASVPKGFATMPKNRLKEVAAKGGKVVSSKSRSQERNSKSKGGFHAARINCTLQGDNTAQNGKSSRISRRKRPVVEHSAHKRNTHMRGGVNAASVTRVVTRLKHVLRKGNLI